MRVTVYAFYNGYCIIVQITGVVDGNVMRVLSRHRLIGAEINKQHVIQHFW